MPMAATGRGVSEAEVKDCQQKGGQTTIREDVHLQAGTREEGQAGQLGDVIIASWRYSI